MKKAIQLICAFSIGIWANTLTAEEIASTVEGPRISYQDIFLGMQNNDLIAEEIAAPAEELHISHNDVFLSAQNNDDDDTHEWVLWLVTGAVVLSAIAPVATTAIPIPVPPCCP